jgi:EmrB/QacA subfamily drug resistance transporter
MSNLESSVPQEPALAVRGRVSRSTLVLVTASAATFMAGLDLFIVNLALPSIRLDLSHASLGAVSWVLNGYALVFAAALVPAGRIADRVGRRRAFLAGMCLFLLASAGCAAAPSLPVLVTARVIQAVGAAIIVPTSLALLLNEFPPAGYAKAIGIWSAAASVAAALGPVLGGLLLQASWRWIFLVNLPVGLLALGVGYATLRESRDPGSDRPDLAGTVLLAAAVAAVALSLVKAPDWGWLGWRTLTGFGAALVILVAFVWQSARHPAPVIDVAMVRARSFSLTSITALLFAISFSAALLANVLYLTTVWHDHVLVAGLSLLPSAALGTACSLRAGRLAARFGQRAVIVFGCALLSAGALWWIWRCGASRDYFAAMLPGLALNGAGFGLAFPTMFSLAAGSLPPTRFATGSAVLSMIRQLGFVLGVSALIAVIGHPTVPRLVGRFHDGWLLGAAAAAAATFVALALPRRDPRSAPVGRASTSTSQQ